MPHSGKYDALVVGAGTAGGTCALALARAGKRVALVERRPLGRAGARWVNGVPLWMFDEASLGRPRFPELRESGRFVVQAHGGNRRISLHRPPFALVDIRRLVGRLHELARDAGVEIIDTSALSEVQLDGAGRIRAAAFERERENFEIEAALFVDATGLNAALRRRVPRLSIDTPSVPRRDLCTAAQHVFELSTPKAAAAWLHAEKLEAGDTLCTVGRYGGFSTANLMVDPQLGEAELLTGAIADGENATGPQIIAHMRRDHPWIGEEKFGGAGAIPLRRPYDRLAGAGLALVGNAACQVFPAHGSGTGIGMIAARLLARYVVEHEDIGGPRALWAYQRAFHRRWSGLLAFYDLVRRHSQSLTPQQVAALFRHGLITRASQHAALQQRLPRPERRELVSMLPGLASRARDAMSLARALGPAPALLAHYSRFPAQLDERALRAWSRRGAWLRGDRADLSALRGD